MTDDEWHAIPNWPEYRVNARGDVLSLKRVVTRQRNNSSYPVKQRILTPTPKPSGVKSVTLSRPGYRTNTYIHLLVADVFGADTGESCVQ